MATLYDITQRNSLTIQPVIPTLTGPVNAYNVRVAEGEQVVFEKQYTTYPNSPDGHWYLWRLIRAFQSAPQILDAKTSLNISGSGGDAFFENVVLQAKTGWLTAILHGETKRGQYPKPWEKVVFVVEIYLLNGPQLEMAEQSVVPLVHTEFLCSPSTVEAFGDELLAECRVALKQRAALGIAAPADDYINT